MSTNPQVTKEEMPPSTLTIIYNKLEDENDARCENDENRQKDRIKRNGDPFALSWNLDRKIKKIKNMLIAGSDA